MKSSEELREALMAMRRKIDLLQTETAHAKLLHATLDAVLGDDSSGDPFGHIFNAIRPVFKHSGAVALLEHPSSSDVLECIAASDPALIGASWAISRSYQKILDGRVIASIAPARQATRRAGRKTHCAHDCPTLYIPLTVHGRRGIMMLQRNVDEDGFDRTHTALAKKFSALISHALAARHTQESAAESRRLKALTDQLRASKEELLYRAHFDPLTDLPNRTHVQELMGSLITNSRADQKLALAFIDLDNFKSVNDLYGHAVGDGFLKNIAGRIKSRIRSTDLAGRISGDEFIVIFNPIAQQADAPILAKRLNDCLMQPVVVEGIEIESSGSIGVAVFPTHGKDYDTLKRHADAAMYQAKLSGKGAVTVYSRALGREVSKRLWLERQMRRAVESGSFKCALQPKVDIVTGEIVGFEALLRWVDRRKTIHAPQEFLHIITDLGLLDDITKMLLSELIAHLPSLDKKYGADIRYSINVTPQQCTAVQFMTDLIGMIAATGRPSSFMLEIIEEAYTSFEVFENDILPSLRRHGIGLSVDDFGTGYSSLAKLADLTVDELKIDRSLISSIYERKRNQGILRAIESLALALGSSVVAEGVEDENERQYLLTKTSIRMVQGFLYQKPRLLDDMLDDSLQESLQPVEA